MSWMQKLYETYEKAQNMGEEDRVEPLLVLPSHSVQQAHIEITLDSEGAFQRAAVVQKEETMIPVTENSVSRTSGGEPHPLCDKIQYVAGDYAKYGGGKSSYFDDFNSGGKTKDGYHTLLGKWLEASRQNPKLRAVHKYVSKRSVVADLVDANILCLDESGKLRTSLPQQESVPEIFRVLPSSEQGKEQGDAFVRWVVEISEERESRVWKDEALQRSWIEYDTNVHDQRGLCFVTGEDSVLCSIHPARLRNGGDKAKLVSSNDTDGYTFRGRFTDADQACSIGYEVTQKVHNALRWLIARQGFRNGDQAIVAWEISGKKLPELMESPMEVFLETDVDLPQLEEYGGDLGQSYARRLNKKIAGYRQHLGESSDIVIMGMDSATPGRMAVTYYRELHGSDFLDRIESWHLLYSWFQEAPQKSWLVGAPLPKKIVMAAFGRRVDDKLSKSTISRVLSCIVDGISIPVDLQRAAFHRAINRVAMDSKKEQQKWQEVLHVACGLYRGLHKEMNYKMALEEDRNTRDYLYGRLLAVAEKMEQVALNVANEPRETNAARSMHHFAQRPFSTWKQIELSLAPYRERLRSNRAGFLVKMLALLDEIHDQFGENVYNDDTPLNGEFLLGYHCQRRALSLKGTEDDGTNNSVNGNDKKQEDDENVSYPKN